MPARTRARKHAPLPLYGGATNLPELITWIGKEFHGGVTYKIGPHMGVSGDLPAKWKTGGVRMPTITNIKRMCETYGLDFNEVIRIIYSGGTLRATARGLTTVVALLMWLFWAPSAWALGPSASSVTTRCVRVSGDGGLCQLARRIAAWLSMGGTGRGGRTPPFGIIGIRADIIGSCAA